MKSFAFILALALAAPSFGALQSAADMSYTQLNASTYRYSIDLHNTGDTTLGTLWFSWIPGYDFMPAAPTNIQTPSNWVGFPVGGYPGDGYSIEWYALGSPVPAGQSLSGFQFDSTVTPSQMTALAPTFPYYTVNHAFVYPGLPEYDPGYELDVHLVPEPMTAAAFGFGAIMCVGWRKRSIAVQ